MGTTNFGSLENTSSDATYMSTTMPVNQYIAVVKEFCHFLQVNFENPSITQ
jgi:hypothetical protein